MANRREWIETAQSLRNGGMTYREIGKAVCKHHSIVHKALNPEAERISRAYVAAYNKEHPEIHILAQKAYDKRNQSARNAREGRRRARKRNGYVSGERSAILEVYRVARDKQDVSCYLCGEYIELGQRHVDHIVPLARGGSHSLGNLGIAHASCNMSKGVKSVEEIGFK